MVVSELSNETVWDAINGLMKRIYVLETARDEPEVAHSTDCTCPRCCTKIYNGLGAGRGVNLGSRPEQADHSHPKTAGAIIATKLPILKKLVVNW